MGGGGGGTVASVPLTWVNRIPDEKASTPESWPPKSDYPFDWSLPTNEAYHDPSQKDFTKDFFDARSRLDYSYHKNPAYARQELQDAILSRVVDAAPERPPNPWICFTAGPMGVGKGYVLSTLYKSNLIPLHKFVKIDPDKLKSELPEFSGYLRSDPESAATKVHRESTQMADILFENSLLSQTSMIVDGSLRDVDYHKTLFQRIRKDHSQYRIAILHITAKRETIHERARKRAERTGRVVPTELLDESVEQVPRSIELLSPHADVVFDIANDNNMPLQIVSTKIGDNTTEGGSWDDFASCWESSKSTGAGTSKCILKRKICSLKPICNSMEKCFTDCTSHEEAAKIWEASYPSFCARCTLASDGQCGVCVHGKHRCACDECGNACPIQRSIALHAECKDYKAVCGLLKSLKGS